MLGELHGQSYKVYQRLAGRCFADEPFHFRLEHVQGDAYAPPSRLSLELPLAAAGLEALNLVDGSRRVRACEDFCLRRVAEALRKAKRESAEDWVWEVAQPSQKIIHRDALTIGAGKLRLIMCGPAREWPPYRWQALSTLTGRDSAARLA